MQNFLPYLAIFVIVVQEISSQNCVLRWKNGTTIQDEGFGIELENIEDIEEPGKTLITLISDNITSIEDIKPEAISKFLYMTATLEETSVILKLTEEFIDFEKYETRDRMSITIYFNCTDGGTRELEVLQQIIDTNNHDPEFIDAPYTYNLSMPFPNDFRVDLLGSISARDIDITNKEISFSLDPQDPVSQAFEASWQSLDPDDPKHHYASLRTKATLHLLSETTFNIYATDSGAPPRTSNTTVTINIDKANSVLSFSRPVYSANCSNLLPEEANGFILKFEEGDISLGGGTDGTIDWSIQDVSGKYNDNFNVNPSSDLKKIDITLVNPPPSFFNETVILLLLNAKKTGAAESTVLHLILPGRQLSTSPDMNDCTDCTAIIITLAVLLAIVLAALITFIILSRRRAKRAEQVEKINGTAESREEMKEVHRMESDPSQNGLPRRSVAFNDTVEEINTINT